MSTEPNEQLHNKKENKLPELVACSTIYNECAIKPMGYLSEMSFEDNIVSIRKSPPKPEVLSPKNEVNPFLFSKNKHKHW